MPRNTYFSLGATSEKRLYEDIVIEGLRIYGHDVYYLPRKIINEDAVFNEALLSEFGQAFQIEMYVETIDGFGGEGDILSKFGLEMRDQMKLVVSDRRWEQLVGRFQNNETRPQEGDLIYFPLVKSLFEIHYVEEETPFYQLQNIPTFTLTCELFEYSNEAIDTGVEAIDEFETDFASRTTLTLGSGSGTYTVGEDVTQSLGRVTVFGEVAEFRSDDNEIDIVGISSSIGNELSIRKFGDYAYKSTASSITIPTADVDDLQHGSVGFWFYVSSAYTGIKTIAEFGSNDNDTEKYSVRLQETDGTVKAFLRFPLNATSSGLGSMTLSTDVETNEWHFFQLAQLDQQFNTRQVHFNNESAFATASYKGNIIDDNGIIINPDEDLSDGDIIYDEFYATTATAEITIPTATLSGQTGEVFFDGGKASDKIFGVTGGDNGNLIGVDSDASYAISSIDTDFKNIDEIDPFADNEEIETFVRDGNFIDFSETNPFGTPDITA